MTLQELYRALADGKKITNNWLYTSDWVQLKGNVFIGSSGFMDTPSFHSPEDWELYEEAEAEARKK